MGDSGTAAIMRRMVARSHPPVPEPVTPARALRQALARAAERSVGLMLSVIGVSQDIAPLDDLLSTVEDGLMLTILADHGGPVGFAGIDLQTRAALIEVQTLGRVSSVAAIPRKVTLADMTMAEPFLSLFLTELARETMGTALDGWVAEQHLQGGFADLREAGLALADGDYRAVRLTLDLGAGGRQGVMVLVLPMPPKPEPAHRAPPATGWSESLAGNVLGAQTEVAAILHRLRLPLHLVEGFELGQVIALPGVSVASVRVETGDGTLVGQARLGQMAGMRAVRLGGPARQEMEDSAALPPVPS